MIKQDPLAKDKTISIYSENPFQTGFYIINLSEKDINFIGCFLNDFYRKVQNERKNERIQITRNALTMIKGAVFALGTKSLGNPEWKEQAASSLREIFHQWKGLDDFKNNLKLIYFKNKNIPDELNKYLGELWLYYGYFTGIDHHEVSKIIHNLQILLKNDSLKWDECCKEKIFLDRVKDFFLLMLNLVKFLNNKK